MNKTTTIILGIAAILVLAGIVWYGGKGDGLGLSDLSGQNQSQEPTPAEEIDSGEDSEPAGQETSQASSLQLEEFILGDPNAPVTMIEYSSPLCGHCINFHQSTLPLIVNQYVKTGKLKLIPRFLTAPQLSMGIFCAHEQGEFWQFSDYLFNHIQELESIDDLKAAAADLGLDGGQFNQCYDQEKYQAEADRWFEQAREAGIQGTPTFFINDQQIVGNQLYAAFEEAIEQELNSTP